MISQRNRIPRNRVGIGLGNRAVAKLAVVFWVLAVTGNPTAIGNPDDGWVLVPYQVKVWVALAPVPELAARRIELNRALRRHLQSNFGPAWNLQSIHVAIGLDEVFWAEDFQPDSSQLPHTLAVAHSKPDQEESTEARQGQNENDENDGQAENDGQQAAVSESYDHAYMVAVRPVGGRFQVRVWAFDRRLREWQNSVSTMVSQSARIANAASRLITQSFSPMGKIGHLKGHGVDVTMRAGLLTSNTNHERIMPPVGTVLRCSSRRFDRLGQVVVDGVDEIPWTLLQVDAHGAGVVTCRVITGLRRNPFRSRPSRQLERLATVVRPHLDSTDLRMVDKANPNAPLVGYDVLARLPEATETQLIGRTDWNGRLQITSDPTHPIQILYVKHGQRVLARLPFVPGANAEEIVRLANDDRRLEAEGFLQGMEDQMVEIAVRRRVLALRIRQAIKLRDFTKADELLDRLSRVATRDDLERKMRVRRSDLRGNDAAVQQRIDKMFRATRNALKQYLRASDIDELRQEVQGAKQAAS